MDKKELVIKLQELYELYRKQAEEYEGPAKAFYLGKSVGLQEVLIWLIDDEEFSMKIMLTQDNIFESIMAAEKAWNKLASNFEED